MRCEPHSGWGITAVHWEQEELLLEYGPGVSAETAQRTVVQVFASGRVPSLKPLGHRAEVAVSALMPLCLRRGPGAVGEGPVGTHRHGTARNPAVRRPESLDRSDVLLSGSDAP